MSVKNQYRKRLFFLITIFFFLVFPLVFLYAEAKKDTSASPRIEVKYSKTAYPGDPFFVQLQFLTLPEGFIYAKAAIKNDKGKVLCHTLFYETKGTKKNKKVFQAVLPLSTWLASGDYRIQVDYFTQSGVQSTDYPLEIAEKSFTRETIKLNSKNTAIKTDTGSQRIRQIERLYTVLGSIDYQIIKNPFPFVLPVDSTRRTSFFGDRRIFTYTNGTSSTDLHYGIDFGVPTGTPVSSCADGTVVLAEERISTGFSIVIEHLPGLYSLYYHLDSFSIAEGQNVSEGQQIGISGATGLATGPHLHWEVRLLGQAVNPDYFIEGEKNTTRSVLELLP